MSEATERLVELLVGRHPPLSGLLEEHLSDNFGELLPHLFFGDLTRYLEEGYVEAERDGPGSSTGSAVRALLADLERAFATGEPEVQELIAVSFLEHLPRPGGPAAEIRGWLGPQLSAQLRAIG